MKYSLRSLMIVLALLPPLLAFAFRQAETVYWRSLITECGSLDRRGSAWDSGWDLPYETGDFTDSNGLSD